MITSDDIIYQLRNNISLYCPAQIDGTDLAACTEFAHQWNTDIISVTPDKIVTLWPWVEYTKIKIYARLHLTDKNNTNTSSANITDIVKRIKGTFKSGAETVQVFVHISDINDFIETIRPIRDDLFFKRNLSVAIDINEIKSPFDWENIFIGLANIGTKSLLLYISTDTGDDSDFVGQIYAALNAYSTTDTIDLHFMTGENLTRAEQVFRLAELICPKTIQNMRFFINWHTEMLKLN